MSQINATLFVGANNETKEVEKQHIIAILSKNHDGFTLYDSTGFYKGDSEPSAIIEITDDEQLIDGTIQELKEMLKQECIGVKKTTPMQFV